MTTVHIPPVVDGTGAHVFARVTIHLVNADGVRIAAWETEGWNMLTEYQNEPLGPDGLDVYLTPQAEVTTTPLAVTTRYSVQVTAEGHTQTYIISVPVSDETINLIDLIAAEGHPPTDYLFDLLDDRYYTQEQVDQIVDDVVVGGGGHVIYTPAGEAMPQRGGLVFEGAEYEDDQPNNKTKVSGFKGDQGDPGPTGAEGPQGLPGEDGTSVKLSGAVPDHGSLPAGAAAGDLWVTTDTGDGWVSDGAAGWSNAGPIQGPQGEQGEQGLAGVDGTDGLQGVAGVDGADGAKGDQGEPGIPGVDGATGPQGVAGQTGAAGPPGIDGADGADGADGTSVVLKGAVPNYGGLPAGAASGDLWITSDTSDGWVSDGAEGWTNVGRIQGPKGDEGDRGERGSAGADGVDGAQGLQGIQGISGVDGADGVQGIPGVDGVDGQDGEQGVQGIPGVNGLQGLQGPQGEQGISGDDGAIGPPGDDGDTPYIQAGNWWIGGADTGVAAEGVDGVSPHIDAGGNWFVGAVDTGVKAQGPQGEQGVPGPSTPSSDANNALQVGSDSLLLAELAGNGSETTIARSDHSHTKADVGLGNVDNTSDANKPVSGPQQTALNLKKDDFTENTAFNKDFGTEADQVCQGNDVRLIKLESAADFLQLAATDALETQTLYWVPDATSDRPLYAYATGPDTYEVVQPSGKMLRDTHMLGHAIVVDDFDGIQHGLIAAAPELGDGVTLFGSHELHPVDLSDATRPVRLYGSEVVLRSPTIRATLSGAEVGSPVVVTNIVTDADGDLALLGASPAPVPDFTVTGTSDADVPILDGGGWTNTLAQISGLAQEVEPGAAADYQLYVSNPGLAPGMVTVGFELEDAIGDPGNWTLGPNTFQLPTIPAGGKSLYTGFLKTSTILPLGANIRLVVSAVGSSADATPGAWTHAANSIGPVDPNTFRVNNQKPTSVNTFRLSNVNIAGQDVSAALLDIQVGSTFTAKRAVGQTAYTVASVAAFGTTGVDIGVTGASGNNTNWSGDVTFDAVLGSGAFTPSVLGSVTETQVTITVAGSGGGGGGGGLVDDLTPQLGGDLDVNGQKIVSISDGDIVIEPDGNGAVVLGDTSGASIRSDVADGATAVAYSLDTASSLATDGADLLRLSINEVEKLSVSLGGSIDLINTVNSDTGIIKKDGSRFIHDYSASGTTGKNTFVGEASGNLTLTGSTTGSEGSYNVGLGAESLEALTTGKFNVMLGSRAGWKLTAGDSNIGVGYGALWNVTTGGYNVGIGQVAMAALTTAGYAVGIGNGALNQLTTGLENIGLGYYAGSHVVEGNWNTAVGSFALGTTIESGLNTHSGNTAIGRYALNGLTAGDYNTAIGMNCGSSLVDGDSCVFIGKSAAYAYTTGDNNTIIGSNAVLNGTTGSDNTIVGMGAAGSLTTGSNNLVLGKDADVVSATGNYQLNIGGVVTGSVVGGTDGLSLESQVADGATAVAYSLDTANALATSGARFFSIASAGVPLFEIHRSASGQNIVRLESDGAAYIVLDTRNSTNDTGFWASKNSTYNGGFTINSIGTKIRFFLGGAGTSDIALNVDPNHNFAFGHGATTAATRVDVNGAITQHELSADPADPVEGSNVTWQSDGTGYGDDGDIVMKITAGGVTKTVTLIDFSAATDEEP